MSGSEAQATSDTEHPPLPVKRSRGKAIGLYALVLCCGFAAGFSVASHTAKRRIWEMRRHPDRMCGRVTRRLSSRLDLTPEQEAKVRAILDKRHKATMAIHREMGPRLTREFDASRKEIGQVLTPDQRKQFDAMMTRVRRRRWPGPEGRGPRGRHHHGRGRRSGRAAPSEKRPHR